MQGPPMRYTTKRAPLVGQRPSRQVNLKSSSVCTGIFMSSKMRAGIAYESQIERDCLLLMDVLEGVAAFESQPLRLSFHLEGRVRSTFPDFLVTLRTGHQELWECKPDDRMPADREAAIRAAARELGLPYRVVTPRWLRRQPILANAARLRRHAGQPVIPQHVLQAAMSGSNVAADLVSRSGCGMDAVLASAMSGAIAINLASHGFPQDAEIRPTRPGAHSGGVVMTSSANAPRGLRIPLTP